MNQDLTHAELAAIAVFPLPNLVLFPGTKLALHIFEPRYREMMRDCLREGRLVLAVAQLKPGWQAEYENRPALYEVAGAGRILTHVLRADGTYDIEVAGTARVRLQELTVESSYRRARAVALHEPTPDAGLSALELTSLLSLATGIVELARQNTQLAGVELLASADDTPSRMLDRLAHQFVSDPAARQCLLETLDVGARLHALKRYMAELRLALVADGGDRSPRTLH